MVWWQVPSPPLSSRGARWTRAIWLCQPRRELRRVQAWQRKWVDVNAQQACVFMHDGDLCLMGHGETEADLKSREAPALGGQLQILKKDAKCPIKCQTALSRLNTMSLNWDGEAHQSHSHTFVNTSCSNLSIQIPAAIAIFPFTLLSAQQVMAWNEAQLQATTCTEVWVLIGTSPSARKPEGVMLQQLPWAVSLNWGMQRLSHNASSPSAKLVPAAGAVGPLPLSCEHRMHWDYFYVVHCIMRRSALP